MKKLLTSFIVVLYTMEICLSSAFFLFFWGDVSNGVIQGLLITSLVLGIIAFFLGLSNIILAITHILVPHQNSYKSIMITKLALIPFFIMNFIICMLVCVAILNPWLFMTSIVIIPLMIGITYGVLLVTSSYNLAHMIRALSKKEATSKELTLHIIFHLIFVLDVISSVILVIKGKKKNKQLLVDSPII